MADSISNLPDPVICYILSFLPTKVSVATSLLSKRWKPLWRSVPAFDFHCQCGYSRKYFKSSVLHDNFDDSIDAFLFSRDPLLSFQRFHLKCYPSVHDGSSCRHKNTSELITAAAVQHKLEHLQLSISTIPLPCAVFSCKTLVVLSLNNPRFKPFYSFDLPSLKIMRLYDVDFRDQKFLADLLSGCPNLEDIDISGVSCILSDATQAKFQKLHKLVRATVNKHIIPLEVVHGVQFLCIKWMDMKEEIIEDLIPQFHNLTSINFGSWGHNTNWPEVVKVIKYCPKLQHLVVDQGGRNDTFEEDGVNREYRLCVPACITLHLKTCRINNYCGHQKEFEFTRYIMQNARVLRNMTIHIYSTMDKYKHKKVELVTKLSLCTQLSPICKLLFTDDKI